MKVPEEGEVLKYRPTGNIFKVKKITSEFVILHSRDGGSQIMTGKKSVFHFFEKIPHMISLGSSLEEFS